jgi:chemotaxis protein MotB
MARVQTWLCISLLAITSVGCVPQEKYNALRTESEALTAQLTTSEREKSEAVAARDLLQRQLEKIGGGADSKDALLVSLTTENGQLHTENADLKVRLNDALGKVGTTVILDPKLNAALQQFAAENPDLVDFDQNRGMVKFKSDVTFSPGSAVLTPTAASAIDRFAQIVNSPSAAGYELMVVGHTDNVPVSHDATRKAGHFDNWYLSAHRAISVSTELQKQAVNPARLEVAGCADQRPVASNSSPAGKALNRRVEVLITSATMHSAIAAAPAPSAPTPMKAAARFVKQDPNKDANKDVVVTPKRPSLNK